MQFTGKIIAACLAVALGAAVCALQASAGPDPVTGPSTEQYTAAGVYRVATLKGAWQDAGRAREVPWLIRYPEDAAGPRPVMVFSHGLGGNREGLQRLSTFLAGHGYIVVHVQHAGSDSAIWNGVRPDPETADRGALLRLASDPQVILNRLADIPFALEQLAGMAAAGEFAGRIDMDRVAMSGHSFGAVTTQAMAGQIFASGASMPAEGFKAFIAMSPSGDRDGNDEAAFARVSKPFLMMTGTEDSFALNPSVGSAEDRTRPYHALPEGVPAVLVNLRGGDHFVFSGSILATGPRPDDSRHHQIIDAAVLAFLDAWLKDDADARQWLVSGLPRVAGEDAAISSRNILP